MRLHVCAHICVFTMSHIVDAIQVALSFFIVHVLAFGLHDLDRVMAEENLTRWPANKGILIFPYVQTVPFTLCKPFFLCCTGLIKIN